LKITNNIFIANGLKCELLLCNEGYPQFFLDDAYNVKGHLGAYIPNSKGYSIEYSFLIKDDFKKLFDKELLTIFNVF